MASPAQAAILPTNLEPKVGANYEPVDADERAIWQSLARLEEEIRTSPQRLNSPELDAYIRDVVERLLDRPAPELRIYVMHDASLNAAMLPSGMMIVNTGLLVRVRNEAQLAAVLAHEAGHYLRRHALDFHRDSRRKSALVSSAPSLFRVDDAWWSQMNYAIMISSSRFSRDLESEADAYGLALMVRAGYPPGAAYTIWGQYVDERRASAAARQKRYRDQTYSELSTHPPTKERMGNLADTAEYLAAKGGLQRGDGRDEWTEVIHPYQAMLLHEQIHLNDPGASLYLLEQLAKEGWTGLLRYHAGEVYRLRGEKGDDARAASEYAAATAQGDAPPEAWRAHGYALLKAGSRTEARDALDQYLAMKPEASDAAMIHFALAAEETSLAGGHMTIDPGPGWKKLPGSTNQNRWEEVWTLNGSQVDRMTLIDGLPEGKAIVFRKKAADQQVPVFRAGMTTQDLTSMLEVAYRTNGVTVFNIEGVEPVDFAGGAGVKLRYNYASGIVFAKRGICVMRVAGQKLYAMKLEGVANDSFDAAAARFDELVARAGLRAR